MTSRRPLLKNRRVWRTHQLNRIWRQRQATDLAGLLALEGNCAIPGTGRPEHMADNARGGIGPIPDPGFWRGHVLAP